MIIARLLAGVEPDLEIARMRGIPRNGLDKGRLSRRRRPDGAVHIRQLQRKIEDSVLTAFEEWKRAQSEAGGRA